MRVSFHFLLVVFSILLFSFAIPLNLRSGKIYKLECQTSGKIYIGRTTVSVEAAIKSNISLFKKYTADPTSRVLSVFELFSHNNYNVTILEDRPELANDEASLKKLQRFYLEQYKDAVNKLVPTRTKTEWDVDNYDHNLQTHRKYYDNNRETILQRRKELQSKTNV